MVKKNGFYSYVIAGLLIFLGLSLIIQYFNIRLLEGLDGNKEDISIALNVKLSDKNGKIIPQPIGSYGFATKSAGFMDEGTMATYDFSMNKVLKVNTTLDKDENNNVKDRTMIIQAKKTKSSNSNDLVKDVIPNKFTLDISFNDVGYILKTVADLKAANKLLAVKKEQNNEQKTPAEPIPVLNILRPDGLLMIQGIGTIYKVNTNSMDDKNNDNPVGNVQNDMNNEKAFKITVNVPSDPENLAKAHVSVIVILFKSPNEAL
jgi:hypothetical protein